MKKFFSSIRFSLVMAGSVLMAGVLLSSCLKNNDDTPATPVSGLMAFNLAADQTAVGISLSGNYLTNTPLTYTSFTGSYLPVYTGTRAVQSVNFNGSAILATASQVFEADKYYSVFVVGNNNVYKNVLVEDKFDSLSGSSGKAYVRFINAIPDSSLPAVTIAAGGTNAVNTPAAFTTVSDFTAITPGDINVTVSNGSTIQANRTFAVEAKKVYTVLLTGIPGQTDVTKAVQIKYITNGTLSDTTTSGRPISGN